MEVVGKWEESKEKEKNDSRVRNIEYKEERESIIKRNKSFLSRLEMSTTEVSKFSKLPFPNGTLLSLGIMGNGKREVKFVR